ncbi:MAG TPA: DUF5666 domain-containing protein [Anaerolineales bacterium]|nr:DUF5666 domain-containing protein [Anaerolineales bacterium]
MSSIANRAVILALAASLTLTGTAAAQEERPQALHAKGEVTSVDVSASTFSLHTLRGEDLTFEVDSETKFEGPQGELEGLEALEPGMLAAIAAERQDDGSLLAIRVVAVNKGDLLRVAGEITGVVPGQGSFTLETRRGVTYEFQTGERTRFVSRDGSIEDIHDLKKGMKAAVLAFRLEGGEWFARVVAAGNPDDRPRIDVRAAGRITRVESSSLTVEARDGRVLVFQVTDATRFKSRDGSVDSFDDLEVGMRAIVLGREEAGELIALGVGVGAPKPIQDTEAAPDRGA